MKIKKLKISGFKSFSEKATIHFPQGICAIVGPNGCGKSNIVDALRWVMGEQSAKMLRGKAMEDIIFSGSKDKPALNMAEVSLILANDNGSTPEEFKTQPEIMLTRRIYRSGERAYMINKQPCRLKDIHNIFMGSGMGPKSYAVIQQGNIGAITDASPEERRHFIDEAAGITRYKTRKKEALQKLDSTQGNLNRLDDILAEIKRQMDSLKRQAKKATAFEKYRSRVRAIDAALSIHRDNEISHQIDENQTILDRLMDMDLAHSSDLKKLDAKIESIRLKRENKKSLINDHQATKFDFQRRIDKLENDLSHLQSETKRLEHECASLSAAKNDLTGKIESMDRELIQHQKEKKRLKDEMQTASSALDRENAAASAIHAKLTQINMDLETEKSGLIRLAAEEAKSNNVHLNAARNKENVKRRLKRINEEKMQAGKDLETLRASKLEVKKKLSALCSEIEDLKALVSELKQNLKQRRDALEIQKQNVRGTESERNIVRSRYTALKKIHTDFECYNDGVKTVMQAARKDEADAGNPHKSGEALAGIVKLVADIVEPKPDYAVALEAALGGALQYVITETQTAGVAALKFLQSNAGGRAGFLSKKDLKPPGAKKREKTHPTPRLLDHVTISAGFEHVIEALIGDISVVPTIEDALNIHNRHNSCHAIVTLNGEMVNRQGILIGGSRDRQTGILEQKEALRQHKTRLVELEKRLIADQKAQRCHEAEIKTLDLRLQKFLEAQYNTTSRMTETEKLLYKNEEELKHCTRRLEIAQLEQEQLLEEKQDIDDEISQCYETATDISARTKRVQAKIDALSEKASLSSTKVTQFDNITVELKLKQASLKARLESNRTTLGRVKDYRDDKSRRLKEILEEISRKTAKKVQAQSTMMTHGKTLIELHTKLEGLDQQLNSHETDFNAFNQQIESENAAISKIETSRAAFRKKIGMIELEQSQRCIRRENNAARIKERYRQDLDTFRREDLGIDPQLTSDTIQLLTNELETTRQKLARITDVNLGAINAYEEQKTRHEFLIGQRDDLLRAIEDLNKVINKINRITKKKFIEIFDRINKKLDVVFPKLFEGGHAKLILSDSKNELEAGVEFIIRPPGKKPTHLSLLSGGEKALSAIAFLFSIFLIKPASFCLLDEIDAPLDEINISRFNTLLQMIGKKSQVIMITHNKSSMGFADSLMGITMEKKGISKVVSVNLDTQH